MTDTTSVVLDEEADNFFGADDDSAPAVAPALEADEPEADDGDAIVVEEVEEEGPKPRQRRTRGTDLTEADAKLADERKKKRAAFNEAAAARQEAFEARREVALLRVERDLERIDNFERIARGVEDQLTEALATGDPDRIGAAQRNHSSAQQDLVYARQMKAQLERDQESLRAAIPASKPFVNEMAEEWAEKNSWFDPQSNSPESKLVRATSALIERAGIPPSDARHFEELNKRLAASLPDRFQKQSEPRKPGRPPTNGGSRTGGAVRPPTNTVRIPSNILADYRRSADYQSERAAGRKDGEIIRDYAQAYQIAYPQGR